MMGWEGPGRRSLNFTAKAGLGEEHFVMSPGAPGKPGRPRKPGSPRAPTGPGGPRIPGIPGNPGLLQNFDISGEPTSATADTRDKAIMATERNLPPFPGIL